MTCLFPKRKHKKKRVKKAKDCFAIIRRFHFLLCSGIFCLHRESAALLACEEKKSNLISVVLYTLMKIIIVKREEDVAGASGWKE